MNIIKTHCMKFSQNKMFKKEVHCTLMSVATDQGGDNCKTEKYIDQCSQFHKIRANGPKRSAKS